MKKTLILITLLTSLGYSQQSLNTNKAMAMAEEDSRLCNMYKTKLLAHTDKMHTERKSDKYAVATFNTYKTKTYEYCKI